MGARKSLLIFKKFFLLFLMVLVKKFFICYHIYRTEAQTKAKAIPIATAKDKAQFKKYVKDAGSQGI